MNYNELCPGCGHRMAMHIIEDVISSKNLNSKVVFALDVACCSLFIDKLKYDSIMCAHGRVIPVSLGINAIKNDSVVISYMGDGAAYSIGLNETITAAMKNEKVLLIVINNGLYAMTGGQASPTTLAGTKTSSTPYGKNKNKMGDAVRIEDLIGNFDIKYLARGALSNNDNIVIAKKYIEKAFENYMSSGGFNMVELISPCPTNNKMDIVSMCKYINEVILKYYKIGEFVC